jgi:RNA polymerase sigma-70 factor, ECF subfamily
MITKSDIENLTKKLEKTNDKERKFHEIYDVFFDDIYKYIALRTPIDESLDITEDIFIKIWKSFENISHYNALKTWIYTIAHNTIVDFYRSHKKHEEIEDDIIDENIHIDKNISMKMNRDILYTYIKKLPAKQAEIIILKFMHDMTNKEIEDILSLSQTHIRVLQHRALKELEQYITTDAKILN